MSHAAANSLRLISSQPLFAPVRRLFLKTVESVLNMQLVPLEIDGDQSIKKLVRQVSKERDMLLSDLEAAQIYHTVRAVAEIRGEMAEVGVYRAASSRIIREAETTKPLHLFDTFQGLPKPSEKDRLFHEGLYRSSLDDVKAYLSKHNDLYFYPGLFPDTAAPIRNKRFSFVHLDVDLYESTLHALEFFWPRLESGGAILSHDYSTSPGVFAAFTEYFSPRKVGVFPLAHSQCLVVKAN
jgi:hypothetical protein